MTGCMSSSWVCCAGGRAVGGARWSVWIEVAYRDQEQPEVAYLGQQPVQGGLIGDRARDDGFLPVAADLEVLEPGGPPPAEDALAPDLVTRVQAHAPSLSLRESARYERGTGSASPEGGLCGWNLSATPTARWCRPIRVPGSGRR